MISKINTISFQSIVIDGKALSVYKGQPEDGKISKTGLESYNEAKKLFEPQIEALERAGINFHIKNEANSLRAFIKEEDRLLIKIQGVPITSRGSTVIDSVKDWNLALSKIIAGGIDFLAKKKQKTSSQKPQ